MNMDALAYARYDEVQDYSGMSNLNKTQKLKTSKAMGVHKKKKKGKKNTTVSKSMFQSNKDANIT